MTASVPPGEIFFVEEGTGPAVLFLHVLAGDHRVFAAQAAALSDRWRTVRVDARGHGRSAVPLGPWAVEDFATDFVSLLERL